MSLRAQISEALKAAMKSHAAEQVSVLRMMNAAIKDRDIAARGEGLETPVGDASILVLLGKMVKQRQDSARAFRDGGRAEMATKEEAEIALIESYLPRQMDGGEMALAIAAAVQDSGASGMKDMGKVMALLKERHAGTMDFGAAGPLVRARLGQG